MIAADLHAQSLRFAQREVARTAVRAVRALEHHELMSELGIAPAINLARHHCHVAVGNYRGAIGKQAREIRALTTS